MKSSPSRARQMGWVAPLLAAAVVFGAWMVQIAIPTLKGGNFDTLYDQHGGFRYLDIAGALFAVGFVWLTASFHGLIRRVEAAESQSA